MIPDGDHTIGVGGGETENAKPAGILIFYRETVPCQGLHYLPYTTGLQGIWDHKIGDRLGRYMRRGVRYR